MERNRSRDIEERRQLTSMEWHCITVWECQLKPKVCQQTLDALEYMLCHIFLEDKRVKPYKITEENPLMVAEIATEYGVTTEYRKYKQQTISDVEHDYLLSIKSTENLGKKGSDETKNKL